jgi:hypothetical protein
MIKAAPQLKKIKEFTPPALKILPPRFFELYHNLPLMQVF